MTVISGAPPLILTAHGSADPRSSATTYAIAAGIRLLRPSVDVRVAFCEQNEPGLLTVLGGLDRPGVVTPLLLASAFHARTDIPSMIRESGAEVFQAETLGEDPRLIRVLRQRLVESGVFASSSVGVLVVAVGSSHAAANARTAFVADALRAGTRWAGVEIAYATGPEPTVLEGIARLRSTGARRIVLAPWFIAPGRITDRVSAIACREGLEMTAPLGAHQLVAATVLDRYNQVLVPHAAA